MVKSVGKYDLHRTLGEGAYGKVKYGVNRETNEAVAVKILDKEKIQRQNMGAQIKKEILIMKMINHKNVIAVKVSAALSTRHHRLQNPSPHTPSRLSISTTFRMCLQLRVKSSSW